MGVPQGVFVAFLFNGSLMAHRTTGFPDERWRAQYTFLGQHVRRNAFTALTGIGVSVLQEARQSALETKYPGRHQVNEGSMEVP